MVTIELPVFGADIAGIGLNTRLFAGPVYVDELLTGLPFSELSETVAELSVVKRAWAEATPVTADAAAEATMAEVKIGAGRMRLCSPRDVDGPTHNGSRVGK
jgi:hypothetical protein